MEEVQLIKHTHMGIVSSLHVLNVHIQYVHYTYTYSNNFARLIADLLSTPRAFCRRPRCLPSPRLMKLQHFFIFVVLFGALWEKKR